MKRQYRNVLCSPTVSNGSSILPGILRNVQDVSHNCPSLRWEAEACVYRLLFPIYWVPPEDYNFLPFLGIAFMQTERTSGTLEKAPSLKSRDLQSQWEFNLEYNCPTRAKPKRYAYWSMKGHVRENQGTLAEGQLQLPGMWVKEGHCGSSSLGTSRAQQNHRTQSRQNQTGLPSQATESWEILNYYCKTLSFGFVTW